MAREDHLISVERLAREQMSAAPPVLLDVRWTLEKPDGRDDYDAGHIPGALYVSLGEQLADSSSTDPTAGRHPLPDPVHFERTIRRWGIDAGTPVVVYDDVAGMGAARAWWLLRWAGVGNVRVLDGGFSAWQAAGHEVSTEAPEAPAPSEFEIVPDSLPTLDADAAAALTGTGTVLDARSRERFRGDTEPLDPQAGHIPGAASAPASDNVRDGFFKPEDELREQFAALGALDGEVGVYCGSGVSACHDALALATLGVESSLYPASWSGWSNDPQRPVATGD
ncbi:sulfurtransferase [Brevibacterium daeguense]|uniref:Sulfurtransferase n=1 Tax=Brevibacterium daeguense TaxID=909936 RepID=A0ABP8EFU9_9MICO|nr:sulfurtransferase [Brevibacterium daeguense]